MKTALTLAILMCSFACTANPLMRSYYKRAPLKGKVKKLRSYALMTSNEAEVRAWGKDHNSVDSFSKTGLMVYSYAVQGNAVTVETKYKYDAKGNKTEELYANDKKYSERKTYKYDNLGRLTRESRYISDQFQSSTRYIYALGQLAAKTDSTSWSLTRTDYMYNNKGETIAKEDSSSGGIERTEYKHDDKGRLTEEHIYSLSGWDQINRYTYYENGNLRSEASNYRKTTYTYDEHNNEVLAEESGPDSEPNGKGRRFASEYVYDSQGNWIRCLSDFPDDRGNVKLLEIREIEYY